MFLSIVLATVCLASSRVLAAYDKPYYEVEDAENLFQEFVKEHNKVYNGREYFERLEIFKENLKNINERNAMFPETVFAVNHFADLKPHELQAYTGFKLSNKAIPQEKVHLFDAPDSFDWRDHNVVTHVKDQHGCGSCYIFSAVVHPGDLSWVNRVDYGPFSGATQPALWAPYQVAAAMGIYANIG